MAHVIQEEGVSFVEYVSPMGNELLSAADVIELKQIDAELEQERKRCQT
jgi:hypothetical protein